MNRRELLTGAAVLAGVTQANAFGIGKEGALFGHAGAVLGRAGTSRQPTYYFSAAGSDANDGRTLATPKQTLSAFNGLTLTATDYVVFRGGDTFAGTMTIPGGGSVLSNIIIGSYGVGSATITPTAGNDGINSVDKSYVTVQDLIVTGPGTGTAGNGIYLQASTAACTNLIVQRCTVTAMAGYGIFLYGGASTGSLVSPQVLYCTANSNTFGLNATSAGIRISGGTGQQNTANNYNCTNLVIRGCTAIGNTGVAGTASWCGAGIFVKQSVGGTVELNVADTNGANCNNAAGPTGIWGANITGVTFQYNVSRNTKTAGGDGGGFDIDGGCDNCVVQFNISQGNAGFGYMIYEYDDVTFTSNNNNVIRFNISYNDLTGACRLISGGTHDASGQVYCNNFHTVTSGSPLKIEKQGGALTYQISNNNFTSAKAATTDIITTIGNPSSCTLTGNNYYTPNTFRITWNGSTYATLALWRAATNQETITGSDTSKNVAPVNIGFAPSTRATPTIPIATIAEPWRPDEASPVLNAGVDLFANYGINPGTIDFFGSALSTSGPWSIGIAAKKSAVKSVVLNTTGSANWTVPADFARMFRVDAIGAGGAGNGLSATGGGSAYAGSDLSALWPTWTAGVSTVPYSIGAAVATSNGQATSFGATTLAAAIALGAAMAVGADAGKTNVGSTGGVGGLASASVGTIVYSGGNGGTSGASFHGGGGGAAGPFGAGGNGAAGGAAGTGGGGGGGADGGRDGFLGAANVGGSGGTGPYGSGGAGSLTNGTAGTQGSGGGGAGNTGGIGGAGGPGVDWRDSTSGLFYGPGGGGGANAANATATNVGGAFGGGGGGRSNPLGGQGGIRILYKTSASI